MVGNESPSIHLVFSVNLQEVVNRVKSGEVEAVDNFHELLLYSTYLLGRFINWEHFAIDRRFDYPRTQSETGRKSKRNAGSSADDKHYSR